MLTIVRRTAMYAFEAKKKSSGVQSRIRRLVDLTVRNLNKRGRGARGENRNSRVIPALLCAWENDRPVADASAFVLTKDFSSEGVGILLAQPFRADQVVISFWLNSVMDEPWHFLGVSQCLRKYGGDRKST